MPTDVAVCPVTGRVMVADRDNRRVQVFTDEFQHVLDISKDGSGRDLLCPWGVAVNQAGEVIVSDGEANTVSVYSQTGSYSRDPG